MENASKALLIAGEVFIGIIVLSIFAYMFQRIYNFAENHQNNAERQKIIVFNTQYTKYATGENNYIYSEDVVTITERVVNWNRDTAIDSEKINLEIYKGAERVYPQLSGISNFDRKTFLVDYKLIGDPERDNKEYKFSCQVGIDENSGRVNEIIIRTQGCRGD